ncbi:CcoQ/FixQ family Cbb3-type cytochrome c oxidase assembly chaperone, partial [Pseudomonas sp. HMWF005]
MVIEMSAGLIRGLGTVVVFVAFVGLTLWVFNRKRTPEFAE